MEDYNKWLKYPRDTLGISASVSTSQKKVVWVPHKTAGFLSGEVISESAGKVVVLTDEGEVTLKDSEVQPQNPAKFDGVDDCAELGYLSEATVFHNLKKRYDRDIFYVGLLFLFFDPLCRKTPF
jgi:myosin protein heavy chain